MQDGGKPGNGGQHVRHDAKCAEQGRPEAGLATPSQARGNRVERPGAGGNDHDQGGDEEFDTHLGSP